MVGINYCGHITSCALVKNGKLIYAAEEERFTENDGSIGKSNKLSKVNNISVDDVKEIYAATVPNV